MAGDQLNRQKLELLSDQMAKKARMQLQWTTDTPAQVDFPTIFYETKIKKARKKLINQKTLKS